MRIPSKYNKMLRNDILSYKNIVKKCKKAYPDWKDDEFNCGQYKFIWGVTKNNTENIIPSYYTENSIQLEYNRETKQFILSLLPDFKENLILFLQNSLKLFEKFVMSSHELKHIKNALITKYNDKYESPLDCYLGIDYDLRNNDYLIADNVILLYVRLYIFVNGYLALMNEYNK